MVGPPKALTEGIPDPASIAEQKAMYAKALEAQYAQGTQQLAEEGKVQKRALEQQADQQKSAYRLQVRSRLEAECLAVDQAANQKLMKLQEAAMAQKAALEQQAAMLTLEYQQKKAEEELLLKQFNIQRQYQEAETELAKQWVQASRGFATVGALGGIAPAGGPANGVLS